jgi:hypothetical protein
MYALPDLSPSMRCLRSGLLKVISSSRDFCAATANGTLPVPSPIPVRLRQAAVTGPSLRGASSRVTRRSGPHLCLVDTAGNHWTEEAGIAASYRRLPASVTCMTFRQTRPHTPNFAVLREFSRLSSIYVRACGAVRPQDKDSVHHGCEMRNSETYATSSIPTPLTLAFARPQSACLLMDGGFQARDQFAPAACLPKPYETIPKYDKWARF